MRGDEENCSKVVKGIAVVDEKSLGMMEVSKIDALGMYLVCVNTSRGTLFN